MGELLKLPSRRKLRGWGGPMGVASINTIFSSPKLVYGINKQHDTEMCEDPIVRQRWSTCQRALCCARNLSEVELFRNECFSPSTMHTIFRVFGPILSSPSRASCSYMSCPCPARSNRVEAPEHHTPRAAHQLPAERHNGFRAGRRRRFVPVPMRSTRAARGRGGREGHIPAGRRCRFIHC